jgi:exoribonuclease R
LSAFPKIKDEVLNTLIFVGEFTEWNSHSEYPSIKVTKCKGSIENKLDLKQAALLALNINLGSFPKLIGEEVEILEKEFSDALVNEEDIKKAYVFSIDGEGTKAIDDAVSIEEFKVILIYMS